MSLCARLPVSAVGAGAQRASCCIECCKALHSLMPFHGNIIFGFDGLTAIFREARPSAWFGQPSLMLQESA
jgi:hypothetical protein